MRFFNCFIITGILIIGCESNTIYEEELQRVCQEEYLLLCELQSIRKEVSGEWDKINVLLENNLPEDMPAEEKSNMIKVRNADLIRMFESFESVNEDVKQALNKTEMFDRTMTSKIVEMKKTKQQIEAKKMLLLEEIQQEKGDEFYQKIKTEYQDYLNQDCELVR